MTNGDIRADNVLLTDDSVIIDWSDGQTCRYPSRELRLNCGCAECVEEWSRRKLLDPATVPSDIRAEDYIMIGKYAVQFLWSDAHYTGIYPFDTIRAVLPCEEATGSDLDGA
jgi:ATP-binding protein involved in chromosome partitioning